MKKRKLNSLSVLPLIGKKVLVRMRHSNGCEGFRDAIWDGTNWLIRRLYAADYAVWDDVEVIGWEE